MADTQPKSFRNFTWLWLRGSFTKPFLVADAVAGGVSMIAVVILWFLTGSPDAAQWQKTMAMWGVAIPLTIFVILLLIQVIRTPWRLYADAHERWLKVARQIQAELMDERENTDKEKQRFLDAKHRHALSRSLQDMKRKQLAVVSGLAARATRDKANFKDARKSLMDLTNCIRNELMETIWLDRFGFELSGDDFPWHAFLESFGGGLLDGGEAHWKQEFQKLEEVITLCGQRLDDVIAAIDRVGD